MMKRFFHTILGIVSAVVLTAVIVPLVLSILLSNIAIQNFAVDYLSSKISDRIGTRVEVGHIAIKFFNRVELEDVFVQDYQKDTLLYVGSLGVGFRGFDFVNNKLMLSSVELQRTSFFLKQDSTRTMNLKRVLNNFRSDKPKVPAEKPFALSAAVLKIDSVHFKLRKHIIKNKPKGVNFTDLDVSDFSFHAQNIELIDDSVRLALDSMSFREKSGFVMHLFRSPQMEVSSTGMKFGRLHFEANSSHLNSKQFNMLYTSWRSFNEFTSQVAFDVDLFDTSVDFATIACFAPKVARFTTGFDIEGRVKGPVRNLSGKLYRAVSEKTTLDVAFSIKGLPKASRTRFMFDVGQLNTIPSEVERLYNAFTGRNLNKISSKLARLGTIGLSGHFDGLLSDFMLQGEMATELGGVEFKGLLKPDSLRQNWVSGNVYVDNFDLGRMLGAEKLSRITLETEARGFLSDDNYGLYAQAQIDKVEFNSYEYNDLSVRGLFSKRMFDGFVGSSDPNLSFNLNGRFDFTGQLPKYDFDLKLFHANLKELNVNRRDSISQLRCNLVAEASGTKMDDINGSARIYNMVYVNHLDTVRTGEVHFKAENSSKSKLLSMNSDFADVEFRGRLSYAKMFDYLNNTLIHYIPLLADKRVISDKARNEEMVENPDMAYYMLDVDVKKANNVAGIFVPGLELAEGSELLFTFNPELNKFALNVNSKFIQKKNLYIENIRLNCRNDADSITLFARADDVLVGGQDMPEFNLMGGVKNNLLKLSVGFRDTMYRTSAMVNTEALFGRDSAGRAQLTVDFGQSMFALENDTWLIESGPIYLKHHGIEVSEFLMSNRDQKLTVTGYYPRYDIGTLSCDLNKFSIAPLSRFVSRMGYGFNGLLDGKLLIHVNQGRKYFYSDIRISELMVNDVAFQNSRLKSYWDEQANRVSVILDNEAKHRLISGGYSPQGQIYDFKADFPHVDFKLLQPILDGVLKNIKGAGRAELHLSGAGNKPKLEGFVEVPRFDATVDFTKVTYSASGRMVFDEKGFYMKGASVSDGATGTGQLDLDFKHDYFKRLTYDIKVLPQQMLALNTTSEDNSLFYGKIYASGAVEIAGRSGKVAMNVAATTENNSEFYMPLTDRVETASASDFVIWQRARNTANDDINSLARRRMMAQRASQQRRSSSGLDINMAVNVRPNTQVQLLIDPKVGDIIKGRGEGQLNLYINPKNNVFNMVGDYRITEGSYLFTLRNIINRLFTIDVGSTIQWTGDPIDALLDIKAVYSVKTSIAPLVVGENSSDYERKIPVDCIISLTDRLSQPTITFDVVAPNADTETQSIVQYNLNTQEMKATQFMWLLLKGSFYTDNNSSSTNIGAATTAATGFEFLSNQLSNWISNDKYNIGIKYHPKDDTKNTTSEIDIAFSTNIFDDRLQLDIEGNYELEDNKSVMNNNSNNLTGNFFLTWLLDRSGKLRARLFTRSVNRFDESQGLQESGVGFYYQEDFNRFRDLFGRKRRQREIKQTQQRADSVQTKFD